MQDVGVYNTEKLEFFMYPTKIIVCTKYQCFRVSYNEYKQVVYLNNLKLDILAGRIKSVVDIAEYTKLKWENCERP